ncbi:hypothetical protein FRX31_033053 [Thalictrum thalictroides]|uniref:Uncharacterized protein n=1 Tax=Thalictrum thalictroides TaxID=46969 RepID=A0A7J6UYV4_THATH|nr:hypothetical protein FRX31_033053 [Thalictrum thalictroides]
MAARLSFSCSKSLLSSEFSQSVFSLVSMDFICHRTRFTDPRTMNVMPTDIVSWAELRPVRMGVNPAQINLALSSRST